MTSAPRGPRELVGALLRPSPSPPRLPVAVPAGIAMLLTVGVPAVLGRPDLGLLASPGALSALYLAARSRRERLRRLPVVQLALVAAVALGAFTAGNAVVAAVVLGLVALVATLLTVGYAVGPPGAVFPVLGAGVAARLAAPTGAGGAGLDPRLVTGCAAGGAVLALLVVTAPLLLPAVRRRDAERPVVPVRFVLDAPGRTVLLRVGAGVLVGVVLTALLGLDRGYWVVVSAVAVLQNGRGRRLTGVRAAHRVLGTVLGAGLFVVAASLLGLPAQPVALAIVLAVLQFVVEMLVVAHYGLALVFVTPLALLIAEAGSAGDPWAIAGTRVVDTAIGCVVALVVLVVERLAAGRVSR